MTADLGGTPLTLDPIRVVPVRLEVREVESTIPCGFQQVWGDASWMGRPVEITSGAGLGSRWGTITYGDRSYAFDAQQLVEAFVAAVAAVDEEEKT